MHVCVLNSKLLFVVVLGLLHFFILKNTIAPQTLFVLPSAATSRSLLYCKGIFCFTSPPGHPCKLEPDFNWLNKAWINRIDTKKGETMHSCRKK